MATTAAGPHRNALSDVLTVMGRELRPVTSDPFSLVVGPAQPLFFLLLFVPLVVQAFVVVLVMIPFGFRPDIAGVALGILLLGILGVGIGSLSCALAIAVRDRAGCSGPSTRHCSSR